MAWRDEISELVKSHDISPSLAAWCDILLFAEKHEDELSLDDLEFLAYHSEKCREYWNADKDEVIIIHKNGKEQEQPIKKKGLDIPKEDVNPNIHRMIENRLEQIKQQEEPEHPEETYSSPHRTEETLVLPIGTDVALVIPMAAAPKN